MDPTNSLHSTQPVCEIDTDSSDDEREIDITESNNVNSEGNNNDYSELFGGKTQEDIMQDIQKLQPSQKREYLAKLLSQMNGSGDGVLANNRDRLKAKLMEKRNMRMGKNNLMNIKEKYESKSQSQSQSQSDSGEQSDKNRKKNQKRRERRKKNKVKQPELDVSNAELD